jgi:hypothetical protein
MSGPERLLHASANDRNDPMFLTDSDPAAHLAASCSGGVDAGRLRQRGHAGARPHDVELRHAVAVALDEGGGGLVVPA